MHLSRLNETTLRTAHTLVTLDRCQACNRIKLF